MKNIEDFIEKQFKHSVDLGCRMQYKYKEMLEFYNSNIPEHVVEQFVKDCWFDYIEEHLKTHDVKKLKEELLKEFPDEIAKIETHKENSFWIDAKSYTVAKELSENEKFKNIVQFFNYYVSTRRGHSMFIEPTYSKDMSKFIYGKCHGVCYHFTDNESAERILNNGLMIKEGTYGIFPRRIYLYATDKMDLRKEDPKELKEFIDTVTNNKKIQQHGLAILKVSLRDFYSYITVYSDTAMETSNNAFFVLNNIPASCIKKLEKFSIENFEI